MTIIAALDALQSTQINLSAAGCYEAARLVGDTKVALRHRYPEALEPDA